MLDRDVNYNDIIDRIEALEERIEDLRDFSRPIEYITYEGGVEVQVLNGWVNPATVLRSTLSEIIFDPTVPSIEVSGTVENALLVDGSDGSVTFAGLSTGYVYATSGVLSVVASATPSTHASTHEVGGSDLVDHDNLTNFVADEHVAHTGVSIGVSGTGLSGGGDISASRTITLTSTSDGATNHSTILASSAAGALTLDDVFVPDGGTFGIAGNELLTVSAGGAFVFSGLANGVGINVTPTRMLHLYNTVGTTAPEVYLEATQDGQQPSVIQYYNVAAPGDNDIIGSHQFWGETSTGALEQYAIIYAYSLDVTNTDTGGGLQFLVVMDDVAHNMLSLSGYNGTVNQGEIILNEDGQDVDTRIEAVGVADAFVVQGSDGQITLGVLGAGLVQSTAGGVLSSSYTIGASITADDYFVPDGGTIGISSNELITFNAAGTIVCSGISGFYVEDGDYIGASGCAWLFDSSNGDISTTASVGIGESTPDRMLEIAGSAPHIHLDSSAHAYLMLDRGADTRDALIAYQTAGSGEWVAGVASATLREDAANSDYSIGYNTGSWTEYFTIDTSGNVGIGITAPLAQCHIDQSAAAGAIPVLFLDQGDTSEQCIQFSSDGVDRDINLYTVNVTGGVTVMWDESEAALSQNQGLRITSGRLGVGLTTPLAIGHFHQGGAAGGIPAVYMRQVDDDMAFYTVSGNSGPGSSTNYNLSDLLGTGSVVGPGDGSWTFVGLYRIALVDNYDDAGELTDGDYWVPFFEPA